MTGNPAETKERRTVRKTMLLKTAATAGALGLLLAGCSGGETPGGSSDDTGGSGMDPSEDVFPVMKDWKGCFALDDLQPIQEYMGSVSVEGGGLIDAAIGEGIDGEAMTCSGNLELATYEASNYSDSGSAELQVGVVPWETPDIAAENYQERLQQLEDAQASGGSDYSDVQEGELGGTWDESYYQSANTGTATELSAYGRSGQWIVYALIHVTHDPGEEDGEPVYPFTTEELVDWVANDYMSQTQSDILEKIESEK